MEPGQRMQLLSFCTPVKGRGFGEEHSVSGRCVSGTIVSSFRTSSVGNTSVWREEYHEHHAQLGFLAFLTEPC